MYNGLHVRHVVRSNINNAMNTNSLSYQFNALSLTPLGLYGYPVMLYRHPVTYQIHPFSLVVAECFPLTHQCCCCDASLPAVLTPQAAHNPPLSTRGTYHPQFAESDRDRRCQTCIVFCCCNE